MVSLYEIDLDDYYSCTNEAPIKWKVEECSKRRINSVL